VAAAGCAREAAAPNDERPAPPNSFLVTTNAGTQLSGTAARIDIRYADAGQPPDVEISISAAGDSGRTWSALTAAPAEFLKTPSLTARVVDGRVVPGTATVQSGRDNTEITSAPAGLLSLRLYNGRLTGDASRMDDEHAARFDGPFVVTCAVPAAATAGGVAPPTPSAGEARPALQVDEGFQSALCRPYATLGGSSQR
jgi:hypothetical protein